MPVLPVLLPALLLGLACAEQLPPRTWVCAVESSFCTTHGGFRAVFSPLHAVGTEGGHCYCGMCDSSIEGFGESLINKALVEVMIPVLWLCMKQQRAGWASKCAKALDASPWVMLASMARCDGKMSLQPEGVLCKTSFVSSFCYSEEGEESGGKAVMSY